MGLWDKLRQASNSLGKLRLSLGPDSYFQYKRGRNHARKQADQRPSDAANRERGEAERGREKAEGEREYEERYERERKGEIARERTKRAEEAEPDR
jgi:hypothetical protein